MNRDRTPLTCALVLSLLIHMVLLSLTFSGQGWVRGFGFAWHIRAFEIPGWRVVLVPPNRRSYPAALRSQSRRSSRWSSRPVLMESCLRHPSPVRRRRGRFRSD